MSWLKREKWKAGIALAGMLLLLVLMVWIPVSAVGAYEGASGLAGPRMATVQATPTEDATVTALNKEKLAQEVQQLENQNAPGFFGWLQTNIAILLSTLTVVIGALIGFFPVVINTAVGLTQIEQDMLDLGRVFNAAKWKVFAKIRMPNAYPYILSALKVTATSAVVGAVVGEFVASQAGLGYVIITTQSSMNTPVAFAALAWISFLGLLLFGAVGAMSRLLAPWAEVSDL